MNEQLKDFLKKASEDESIKDELKALEGLSAEERLQSHGKPASTCRPRTSPPHRRNSMKTSWAPSPEAKPAAASTPVWAWLTTAGRCANARPREREFGGIRARSARSLPSAALWGRSARRGRDCGCISLGGGS